MASIKKHAVKGVRWGAIENIGVRLLTLLSFLVLARLLDKEAFGVVALAMAYVLFLELIVRVGFTEVIVQKKELTEIHKDTAFWASVVLGCIALILTWLLAPIAAKISDSNVMEDIIYWLALGIIPLSRPFFLPNEISPAVYLPRISLSSIENLNPLSVLQSSSTMT